MPVLQMCSKEVNPQERRISLEKPDCQKGKKQQHPTRIPKIHPSTWIVDVEGKEGGQIVPIYLAFLGKTACGPVWQETEPFNQVARTVPIKIHIMEM